MASLSMLSSRTSGFASSGRSQLGAASTASLRVPVAPLRIEAAHKKGAGSTKNGRDSNSQRRGVKVYGDQAVKAGGIIIRQVGNTWHAGSGVGQGKDYTLYALDAGVVKYEKIKGRKCISVYAPEPVAEPVPGSRKALRREQYVPRAQLREAAFAEAAAV
jgi:large subunit ribosomal protein L27